jgi:hypothetical protein
MPVVRFSMKWIALLIALIVSALSLAGCGGGGGGGGGNSSSSSTGGSSGSSVVFSGTLFEVDGVTPVPGYTVTYDGNGSPSTVTGSNGTFSLSVPTSELVLQSTGNPYLTFSDGTPSTDQTYYLESTPTNQLSGATGLIVYLGPPGAPVFPTT